jgi:hypothetical protein
MNFRPRQRGKSQRCRTKAAPRLDPWVYFIKSLDFLVPLGAYLPSLAAAVSHIMGTWIHDSFQILRKFAESTYFTVTIHGPAWKITRGLGLQAPPKTEIARYDGEKRASRAKRGLTCRG